MNAGVNLRWEELHKLFSVVICLDESLAVVRASPTLTKHVSGLENAPCLLEIFDVIRPNGIDTFSDALANLDSLYLMITRDKRFAIRGQLLHIQSEGRDMLYFCGAPWLFWLNSNHPDVGLELADFTVQDVQLDQLFFMSTEKTMVSDLEQVNRDLISAREEAEAAQEAKSRIFARMSHEMRTPLNAVVSALALMQSQSLSSEALELLSMASKASTHLMQVINYVLDISKLEAVDGTIETSEFDLQDVLNFTVDLLHPRADEKSVTIRVDNDPNILKKYTGDMLRLRQTLLNLGINAVKFTDTGSVILRTRLVGQSDLQHRVRFEVIDTGIGIPSDIQDKVFQPFWSTQAQKQRASERGTGLGLDIVRSNIELMGGELGLQSTPGKGSTFWFEVPLTAIPETIKLPIEEPLNKQALAQNRLSGKVLLVDDNEANLMLGGMILESLGITVTQAAGGTEAVTKARQGCFDLVLMDLNMPDMDGLEATRQLRKFADKKMLPVVALTAYADARETDRCLEVGMNAYLTKPIVREELARELALWLPVAREEDIPQSANKEPVNHPDLITEQALVDISILIALRNEIGVDNLDMVLEKFRSESAMRWTEMETAIADSDSATAMRLLHTLASTFRSLGLMTAGDTLADIESQYRSSGQPCSGWLSETTRLKDSSLAALQETINDF